MNVYLNPPAGLSRAMRRVSQALAAHKPKHVTIVDKRDAADLVVLHVIGITDVPELCHDLQSRGQKFSVLQYCYKTAGGDLSDWSAIWREAQSVYSYYNLEATMRFANLGGGNFYHAPLGVDAAFTQDFVEGERNTGIVTSGYVAGNGAEAIEEACLAAIHCGYPVTHLGPRPVGMKQVLSRMRMVLHISDATLAGLYRSSLFVSGLRHVEGFELPALEGLVCGARPILFDRPEMRRWYGEHAEYVTEETGTPLIESLCNVFAKGARPVTVSERQEVKAKFDWSHIAAGFWERTL
jgi:glycosyltransferase involved in cell wall biosynthesis